MHIFLIKHSILPTWLVYEGFEELIIGVEGERLQFLLIYMAVFIWNLISSGFAFSSFLAGTKDPLVK